MALPNGLTFYLPSRRHVEGRPLPLQGNLPAPALCALRLRDPARRHDRRRGGQHGNVRSLGCAAGAARAGRGHRADARRRMHETERPAQRPRKRHRAREGRRQRRPHFGIHQLSRLQHRLAQAGRSPRLGHAAADPPALLGTPGGAGDGRRPVRVAGDDHGRTRHPDHQLPEDRLRGRRVRDFPHAPGGPLAADRADRHGISRPGARQPAPGADFASPRRTASRWKSASGFWTTTSCVLARSGHGGPKARRKPKRRRSKSSLCPRRQGRRRCGRCSCPRPRSGACPCPSGPPRLVVTRSTSKIFRPSCQTQIRPPRPVAER